MTAKHRDVSVRIWDETRHHEDDPTVKENDWRDPDRALVCEGYTVYSNDLDYQESHSKSEPDWSLGGEIRDSRNRVIDTFKGEPIQVIKQAILEGRLLYGALVARDLQMHN